MGNYIQQISRVDFRLPVVGSADIFRRISSMSRRFDQFDVTRGVVIEIDGIRSSPRRDDEIDFLKTNLSIIERIITVAIDLFIKFP